MAQLCNYSPLSGGSLDPAWGIAVPSAEPPSRLQFLIYCEFEKCLHGGKAQGHSQGSSFWQGLGHARLWLHLDAPGITRTLK